MKTRREAEAEKEAKRRLILEESTRHHDVREHLVDKLEFHRLLDEVAEDYLLEEQIEDKAKEVLKEWNEIRKKYDKGFRA